MTAPSPVPVSLSPPIKSVPTLNSLRNINLLEELSAMNEQDKDNTASVRDSDTGKNRQSVNFADKEKGSLYRAWARKTLDQADFILSPWSDTAAVRPIKMEPVAGAIVTLKVCMHACMYLCIYVCCPSRWSLWLARSLP